MVLHLGVMEKGSSGVEGTTHKLHFVKQQVLEDEEILEAGLSSRLWRGRQDYDIIAGKIRDILKEEEGAKKDNGACIEEEGLSSRLWRARQDYDEAVIGGDFEEEEEEEEGDTEDNGSSKEEGAEEDKGEEEEEEEDNAVYYGQALKRLKRRNLDRISTLPDSCLLHILSFLPMKDAIITGVLSTRWEFLWTSASTLIFQNQDFIEDHICTFVTGVGKALFLCKNTSINKFAVSFRYKDCFASNLNLWIRFATLREVEELDLHLTFSRACRYTFKLPQHLYSNSSLKNMRLSNCNLVPTGIIKWELLRSLSLEYLELSEVLIQKILSGSPVLELLKLKAFRGICCLAINSKSVRDLIVDHCSGEVIEESWMEISGPNLQSLHILGPVHGRKFLLRNISSTVKATLDFSCDTCYLDMKDDYKKQCNLLRGLIGSLQHVNELKLGMWCIQALSILQVKAPCSQSRSWKHLTLNTKIKQRDMSGIKSLLFDSPHLTTLIINMEPVASHKTLVFSQQFVDAYKLDGENYCWASSQTQYKNPQDVLQHLKVMKIVGFTSKSCRLVVPLMKFVLQNAISLEKLIISSQGGVSNKKCAACSITRDFVEVTKVLLGFPRSSPHAVIEFSD